MTETNTEVETKKDTPPVAERDFAIIRITGRSRKTDTDLVSIGVNGEKRRIMRNKFVPIERRFVEALKNAKEPVVESDDGQGAVQQMRRRKIVDSSPRYPFELVAWINESQFKKLRKIVLPPYQGGQGKTLTDDQVYGLN